MSVYMCLYLYVCVHLVCWYLWCFYVRIGIHVCGFARVFGSLLNVSVPVHSF